MGEGRGPPPFHRGKLVDHLKLILPDEPTWFVVGIGQHVLTKACSTMEEVRAACLAFSEKGLNSYFAQASFVDPSRGRKQANVRSIKSFWLDVDVGKKSNCYATKDEALEAICKFADDTKVQPTRIVSSGMGFYVHYVLTEALIPAQWLPLAKRLGKLCAERGFIVDPACTSDSARILRMPGTRHVKSGNIVSVVIDDGPLHTPEEMEAWLGVSSEDHAGPPTVWSPFGQDVFASPPVYRAQTIVDNCRQVREGGSGSEPSWYAMMSVLRRCVDGLEWAHRLSETDPRYDHGDCERKFEHAPVDWPATCLKFEELRPELCVGCQWKGQVKSPVALYRRVGGCNPAVEVEEITSSQLKRGMTLDIGKIFKIVPRGFEGTRFSVTDKGLVWHDSEKTETGEYVSVDHVIADARVLYLYSTKEDGDWRHWFQSYALNGRPLTDPVSIVSSELSSPNGSYAVMNRMLVFSNDFAKYGASMFQRFQNAYLSSLVKNNAIRMMNVADSFGWRAVCDADGNDMLGFSIGEGLVTAEGLRQQMYSGPAKSIAQFLGHVGDLEEWKRIPEMYKVLDQKQGQLAFCLAFATPLMIYGSGTATSAIFSMWSNESGLGKTQLMRALATIWGDPDKQFVQRHASPTAKMRTCAILNNLPVFMDELTDVSEEDLYSLAYTLIGGQEKQKLTRSGKDMVETGRWNTVTFCTANRSMKDAVAKGSGSSSAATVRVMECECDFQSFANEPDIQKYILSCVDLCKKHYGLAGPEFMYNLLQRSDRLMTLPDYVDNWVTENGFVNEERFMSNPLALAMKAGRWAVEWGLLPFDMDALEDWVMDIFVANNRKTTKTLRFDPMEVMLDYLLSRQRNMLVVKNEVRAGRPPKVGQLDNDYVVSAPYNSDIFVRLALSEMQLTFSMSDFDNWCRRRWSTLGRRVVKALTEDGLRIDFSQKNLGAGSPRFQLPKSYCGILYAADLKKLGYEYEPEVSNEQKSDD